MLILIPSNVPKTLVAASLPAELAKELAAHNSASSAEATIRLRVAVHAGEVLLDNHGVVGRSVNLAFRMLDASAVKSALADSSGVLVLIVSDWFFQEVIRHEPLCKPATYRRALITVKETAAIAWISLPDYPYPPSDETLRFAADTGLESERVAPKQLPPAVSNFVGRVKELDELSSLLEQPTGRSMSVVITAIAGTAGVGKTALAVQWSRQVQSRFPDGQLYVNLRGYDQGPPLSPGRALDGILRALNVPAERIPTNIDAQAALYRSLVDGQRMLVVLDNANTAEQVRPLLPGSPTCLAIVTSRSRLSALVARDGAHRISLKPLDSAAAVTLLRNIVGDARVEAEPHAAVELARRCTYLPLALRIAAEQVAAHTHNTLAHLANELAAESGRLDILTADDETTAVRTAFSWSYGSLSDDAARMFRLLGLHPGPDVGIMAAAVLADSTINQARRLLDTLTGVHLLDEIGPDRYRFHDLLRVYAAECAHAEDPGKDRSAAIRRLINWYLHTADAAQQVLLPELPRIELDRLETIHPPVFHGYGQAMAWYDVERANLVAAVRLASTNGLYEAAWKLPMALLGFFNLRRAWEDWLATYEIGLTASRRIHDQHGEAWISASLGHAYRELHRLDEAEEYSQQALRIFRDIGFRWGEGAAIYNLGGVYRSQGRFTESLDYLQQSLAIFRETGNRQGESRNLTALGNAFREMRRYQDALYWHGQALHIYRDIGDKQGQGVALDDMGAAHAELQQIDESLDCYRQALAIHRENGDRVGEGQTLQATGELLYRSGRLDAATESLRQALQILEESKDPRSDQLRLRIEMLTRDTPDQNLRLVRKVINLLVGGTAAAISRARGRAASIESIVSLSIIGPVAYRARLAPQVWPFTRSPRRGGRISNLGGFALQHRPDGLASAGPWVDPELPGEVGGQPQSPAAFGIETTCRRNAGDIGGLVPDLQPYPAVAPADADLDLGSRHDPRGVRGQLGQDDGRVQLLLAVGVEHRALARVEVLVVFEDVHRGLHGVETGPALLEQFEPGVRPGPFRCRESAVGSD